MLSFITCVVYASCTVYPTSALYLFNYTDGQLMFPGKSQGVNNSGFTAHTIYVETFELHNCSVKAAKENIQTYMSLVEKDTHTHK